MSTTVGDRPVSNWNIANALTSLRIVMVPFFGWALLAEDGQSILWRCVAFGLFVVAMITDKVDGDLARSRGLVTDFGKIADPIADKAMTGMAFIGLSVIGEVWWWVTIVVLAREWTVTALRLSVAKSVVMASAWSGKLKTTFQVVALSGLTLPLLLVDGALETPGLVLWWVVAVALAAAVALTLWSGWEFVRDIRRHRAAASVDA